MSSEPETDTAHYKQVLRGLVDMANDMARLAHGQASRQADAANAALPPTSPNQTPFPDPAEAFDQLARTIRRTILLAERLEEAPARNHRIAARKRILREVEDQIQLQADKREAPALRAELLDRLDAPDLEEEIDTRPTADIIKDICRDLRVTSTGGPCFERRTPAQIETLRQRAAAIPQTWTTPPPTTPPPAPTTPPKARRNQPNTKTLLAQYAHLFKDTG